jgi:hypothetical protein
MYATQRVRQCGIAESCLIISTAAYMMDLTDEEQEERVMKSEDKE